MHTAVPRFCEDMRKKSKKEKEMEKKKKNQKKTRETNTKKNKRTGGFNRSAHSAEPSRGEVARSEGNDDNSNNNKRKYDIEARQGSFDGWNRRGGCQSNLQEAIRQPTWSLCQAPRTPKVIPNKPPQTFSPKCARRNARSG